MIDSTEKPYQETVSSVLISADKKYLVVMTPRFHYVFPVPAPLLKSLTNSFHPWVGATLSQFRVNPDGKVHGTVSLWVTHAPANFVDEAVASGFKKTPDGASSVVTLTGKRYAAGDVQPSAQYKLNATYAVQVVGEGKVEGISPVAAVGDTIVISAVVLFVVFHPHWPG